MKLPLGHNTPLCALIAAGSLLSLQSARAVTEVDVMSTAGQGAYNSDVSATDLINSGMSSVLSYTSTQASGDAGTGIVGIYNGSAVNDELSANGSLTYLGATQFGTKLGTSPTLTIKFNLNNGTGGSSTGYTLTNIQSIYGWRDFGSMSDQSYTIRVSTDPAQLTFTTLYVVNYHPFDPSSDLDMNQPNSSKVTLTDLNAAGITAIQFQFTTYNNGTKSQAGQLIREIDVNGVATPAPEPTTIALLAGGLAATAIMRRRRSF
jgi:hypothetical protein